MTNAPCWTVLNAAQQTVNTERGYYGEAAPHPVYRNEVDICDGHRGIAGEVRIDPGTYPSRLTEYTDKVNGPLVGEPLLVGSRYNINGCITMTPKARVCVSICAT